MTDKELHSEVKELRREVKELRRQLSVTAVVLSDHIDKEGTTTLWDLHLKTYQNWPYITQAQAEKAIK
jgi:hypothetical protein